MKITVIGESNIDIAVSSLAEHNTNGCTPGTIAFHHGGVARNIAHNLCLLGHEVKLMSIFGGDDFAERLMADCRLIGMDLSLSTQFKDIKSPIFLSFNDEIGEMQSAVSDVALNNRMVLDWLRNKMEAVNDADFVVADTLLSTEALAYLIDHCKVPLFVDTVSPGKAVRFADALKLCEKRSVFALKCNMAEARRITGEDDAIKAAKKLDDNGINSTYLTLGSSGVVCCANGITKAYPALPTKIVNVTGSGDAFFSGVIHGHALGYNSMDAVTFGLKAAQHNIKSEAPVNPTLRISIFNEH